VGGGWGTFLEIDPEMLEGNFRVNVMGLLYLAREVAPAMIEAGNGAIFVTGNTSAVRGKATLPASRRPRRPANLVGIDRARSRAARHPRAYVLIDAVIDVPRMRQRFREAPDEFFIKPSAIADELWHLYNQDRSAWSFLAELRPFAEKW
jgi:Short-chain dehydrogenases of various substrate specificities